VKELKTYLILKLNTLTLIL